MMAASPRRVAAGLPHRGCENGGVRDGSQGACDAATGTLADVMPQRKRGAVTVPERNDGESLEVTQAVL